MKRFGGSRGNGGDEEELREIKDDPISRSISYFIYIIRIGRTSSIASRNIALY